MGTVVTERTKRMERTRKTHCPKYPLNRLQSSSDCLQTRWRVESVLIDRDQRIQILLEGSIRKKTKADKMAEELDDISVSDLIEAYILR